MDFQQHHGRHQSRVIVHTIIGLCNTPFGTGTSLTVQDGGSNGRFGAVLEQAALLRTMTVAIADTCDFFSSIFEDHRTSQCTD